MKKIYFSLFSFFCVVAANAQLTQANHAPANGDKYDMYQCDSVSPGPSGANVVWNFASITTHSSIIKNFIAQAVTTTTYPAANVAVGSTASDVSYLASATNSLGYYGGNIGVGAVTGSITYTAPAVYASYPMNLNTTGTGATGGTLSIPAFNATGTFVGSSTVVADGSGTINLPGGVTFSNTLRVTTSQTMNIATSLLGTSATVTLINYNYYTSGIKAPVFSISTATAIISSFAGPSTTTQTFVTRNKNAVVTPTTPSNPDLVGISENNSESFHFGAFPNPSSSYVNFVTNHPDAKQVSVYDITGKLVEKQVLNEGKVKVDVSSFYKGLYLYIVSTGDNRTLKSGKITVSQ